jgi:hypothetical protein
MKIIGLRIAAWIAILMCFLLAWYFLFMTLSQTKIPGFPLDDSWIHLTIARNIAHGHGFSINPGIPVAASTAPLFTCLLSLGFFFTSNYFWIAYTLGILLTCGAIMMIEQFTRHLVNDKWIILFAAIMYVFTYPVTWNALSGMEPPLYILLALGMFWVYIKSLSLDGYYHYWVPVFGGLLVWTRPECGLLFMMILLDMIVLHLTNRKKSFPWKELGGYIIIFSVLVVAWMLFNYSLNGFIFPNSFYAKRLFSNKLGLIELLLNGEIFQTTGKGIYLAYIDQIRALRWSNTILTPFFVMGFIKLHYDMYKNRLPFKSSIFLFIYLLNPLLVAIFIPYSAYYYQHTRYHAYIFPFYTIIGAYGFSWFLSFLSQVNTVKDIFNFNRMINTEHAEASNIEYTPGAKRRYTMILSLFAIGLIPFVFVNTQLQVDDYMIGVKNINDMQVTIGQRLYRETPGNAVIATNDIGAISYFSERKIVDVVGLSNPEILPYFKNYYSRRTNVLKYLNDHPVDYLVIFPSWYPGLGDDTTKFKELYKVTLDDNQTCGGNEMLVFKVIR